MRLKGKGLVFGLSTSIYGIKPRQNRGRADPKDFELQNPKEAFKASLLLSGPHFFPCVRLPGHQFGTWLCWISIPWRRGQPHSSAAAFPYCSSKGHTLSRGLYPLAFLHSLLKKGLSLFFDYWYVIRCVLPIACESCCRTAGQIMHCASPWTAAPLCNLPISGLQYKNSDTKPASLLLYRNWKTPYLICGQPADVSCEVLPTALSLSYSN